MNSPINSSTSSSTSGSSSSAAASGTGYRLSAKSPLLDVQDLSVAFGASVAVNQVSFSIREGERLALVGESGSGKSVTALSLLRLVREAQVSGKIVFAGQDLTHASERQLRAIRGARIAMIFQEPMSALNPLFTVGEQIAETLRVHEALKNAREVAEETVRLLSRCGIAEPQLRVHSYPHQLSGGERQRAMIAMALACKPQLLIADEPTTALDMTIRAQIVQLLLDLQRDATAIGGQSMAVLLITHDLNLVRRFAERVIVMERGRMVEQGPVSAIFSAPQHPYTIRLLDSQPRRELQAGPPGAQVILEASDLSVDFPGRRPPRQWWRRAPPTQAVRSVNLTVHAGETLGVVGESGSGKSTLAMALLGLQRTSAGSIAFEGRDLKGFTGPSRQALRARLQVVFQDPYGALSPRQTVGRIVEEGLALHQPNMSPQARRERVLAALAEVGLDADVTARYPHAFSGGQRQRIAIARALVVEPRLLILDEPTSALDVSVQRQVLTLLAQLQSSRDLAYLFISHDLDVVAAMSHRIAVMRGGEIVEEGTTEHITKAPQHAYTQQLFAAVR